LAPGEYFWRRFAQLSMKGTGTMDKTFDLMVEGMSNDPYKVAPLALELNNLVWNEDVPPDIVVLPGGTMLIKTGRYLTSGNHYCYRIATVAFLIEGKLEKK